MKLVIDRDKWDCGNGSGYLLTPGADSPKMCFLGFVALAHGATVEQILGVASPSVTPDIAWPEELKPQYHADKDAYSDSGLASEMMETNDSGLLSQEYREHQLADLARAIDIEVEFIGGAQ